MQWISSSHREYYKKIPKKDWNYFLKREIFFTYILQYAGDPIDCTNDLKSAADSMLDNYCWVKGLYKKIFLQAVICLTSI